MSWTLRELIAVLAPDIELVTTDVSVDRPVTWAHVSELADPSPWLGGDELLLAVGQKFPSDSVGQVGYISQFDRHPIAGIAFDEGAARRLHPDAVARAGELDVPIISVKSSASFSAIVKAVAARNLDGIAKQFSDQLGALEVLESGLNSGQAGPYSFQSALANVGYGLAAVSLDGHPLLKSIPIPDSSIRGTNTDNTSAKAGSANSALHYPVVVGARRVGTLIFTPQGGRSQRIGRAGLDIVTVMITHQVTHDDDLREQEDARRGLLFRLLCDSAPGSLAISNMLWSEGFEPGSGIFAVAIRSADRGPVDIPRLSRWLSSERVPYLLSVEDGVTAVVQCPVTDLRRLAAGQLLHVGSSQPVIDLGRLPAACREAAAALSGLSENGPGGLARYGDFPNHLSLLPTGDAELVRTIRAGIGAVLDHDAVTGSNLRASLRTYLEFGRNLKAAAAALYVHPNTLAYRVRQVERLIGRNLNDIRSQTDVWLALEAFRVLDEPITPVTARNNPHR